MMNANKRTAEDFIQGVFAPTVTVQCTSDAEDVCRRNNLSFAELVQPFCQQVEVSVRPPNLLQGSVVAKLHINVRDLNSPVPQLAAAKKLLNDSVANVQPPLNENAASLTKIKAGSYNLLVSTSTPWFYSYRDAFFRVLPPLEHDFTRHFLACIFVVSSEHGSPEEEFEKMAQGHQAGLSEGSQRWFFPQCLKYYLLLHDVSQGNQAKAEASFQTLKRNYGANSCHLLQMNSVPANDPSATNLPDVWSPFLHLDAPDKVTSNLEGPDKLRESNSSLDEDAFQQGEEVIPCEEAPREKCGVQHPLLSSGDSSPPTLEPQVVEEKGWQRKPGSRLGSCLTQSDRARLRVFVQEFCSQALVPYVEEQMRILNDQVTNKKGIHRSFMSMKKLFAGSKTTPQGPHASVNSVVYGQDAPELQVRRLGDLAFLFQLYEFAYQAYHSAKRDFSGDSAWLHLAGAQEMAALAVFMAGVSAQRPFPVRYMDSAIDLYLNTCKVPQLATRAALLSAECLWQVGQASVAAGQLIRLTSEGSDLRSALLLEQAALCFLRATPTCPRKFAFHLVLSGHRFAKAAHRRHALHAYSQALQVYQGRGWSLAEGHMQFTIGRQSAQLKQLVRAREAFHRLLAQRSAQSPSQQLLFLREFLLVLRTQAGPERVELPVPRVSEGATRVLLGAEGSPPGEPWLEEMAARATHGGILPLTFRPQLNCLNSSTDNSVRPLAVVLEPITVELELHNPLQIALQLTEMYLLWTFTPSCDNGLVSNDSDLGQDCDVDGIVKTDILSEVLLEPEQTQKVQLRVCPQKCGQLQIGGLAYCLGLSAAQREAAAPLGPLPSPVRGYQPLTVPAKACPVLPLKGARPDLRLQPTVVGPMPRLTVTFSELPGQLLCGEVRKATVELRNADGCPALHSLRLACAQPQLFCLCPVSDDEDEAYHEEPLRPSPPVLAQAPPLAWVQAPAVGAHMEGGQGVALPFWLRGAEKPGRHVLHLLFYYQGPQGQLSHRVLWHQISFTTLPSLTLQASVRQSVSLGVAGSPDGALISLQVSNACETDGLNGVDLSLLQVTCVSRVWSLVPLTSHPKLGTTVVKPQETKNLILRVTPFSSKLSQDNTTVVSQLPLTRVQLESGRSPCLEFCSWWGQELPLPGSETMGHPGAVSVVPDETPALQPLEITLAVIWKPADLKPAIPVYPSVSLVAPTFQYVRCALVHPVQVKHDFVTNRLLVIPVSLLVHNPSFRPVTVTVEPGNRAPAAATSPTTTPDMVATDVGGFSWTTAVRRHLPIKSHTTAAVALSATFSKAGTYNMAALHVSVLTDDGRLSHELLCPSLMVVQQPQTL
ncbi:trafficking protein particle complex subunit 8 isoform X3 [Rhipicephalus sanguineus]|uniref:trafficking protein particle complex subunit 8 isoform X3 n=1 Tax=Rhipicephalus sanguineus TaxID=34632 RepID=UPI0020C57F19|nr:trafficking protein particle complex subunit 8 isoform X3 [Rhipicephalus sanguineus]